MGFNANDKISGTAASGVSTLIGTIVVPPRAEIMVAEVANADSYNLSAFSIVAKVPTPGASGVTIASSTADFTQATVKYPLLRSTADLSGMAKNTQALLILDVRSIGSLLFYATGNAGATVVTVRWSA